MIEAIGIFASVLVLISFVFNNAIVIRAINTLGAILFVVYGIAIDAIAVWFLNGSLVLVHIYHLVRMMRDEQR